jgi:HSP20 family protein
MERRYPDIMWAEACAVLVRAERLQRQFFRPTRSIWSGPTWEPPVDILETDREVLVLVALPGVDPDQVDTVIDGGDLIVTGVRRLPDALRTAAIHRLELPQGRFQRRVALPAGRYARIGRSVVDGCILLTLEKMEVSHG